MLKNSLNITDNLFSHSYSSSWYNRPKFFEWDRTFNSDLMVFTDNSLSKVDEIDCEKKIAWLVESPSITKESYDYIKNNHHKFYKILTFDRQILENIPNTNLLPIGGCWIKEEDIKIHKKNKLVSIIVSTKRNLEGHILRHNIVDNFPNIHVYGSGYNHIDNKITGLKDYKFSIVVENQKTDYYFTEKLIDCFVTGTIPIYWGCPSIGNFFNIEGMVTFENIEDLNNIIENLDSIYEKKVGYIEENFNLAKKYLIADDLVFQELKKEKLI
jgi:hypothetical protein